MEKRNDYDRISIRNARREAKLEIVISIKMNRKQTKSNQITKPNFFHLPSKFNLLTYLGIIVLYSVILFTFLYVVFPDQKYVVDHNYPLRVYNKDIHYYVAVQNVVKEHVPDPANNPDVKVYRNETKTFAYLQQAGDQKLVSVKYANSAIDKAGYMNYFYETGNPVSIPRTHISSEKTIYLYDDNWLDKLYFKTSYLYNDQETSDRTVLEFAENVVTLNKSELRKGLFEKEGPHDDLAKAEFVLQQSKDYEERYTWYFNVRLKNPLDPHHINMQSWIQVENGTFYPLSGLYNYTYKASYIRESTGFIYKYIKPQWIYSKIIYTNPDTGDVYTIYDKVSISSLLLN